MRQVPAFLFVLHVMCVVCGAQVAHLELVPPGRLPVSWPRWSAYARKLYEQCRDPGRWWLTVESELHDNGAGENITTERAGLLRDAFAYPRTYARVSLAALPGDAGFCARCDVPYCPRHWHSAHGPASVCPRGHPR
ncbi:hypothetical protein [Streptomyces sp. NPDC045470]|uniref:hypothetical protein n=1 Tax=unclassified Streptomyces TaxID=2593676 RepID=UPI0033D244EE